MILAVAIGGALGAVCRFLLTFVDRHYIGYGFPLGTVIVNALGSLLLGVILEASALSWSPSAEMRAFLIVGILGAFTTFSTFSLDAVTLWTRGEFILAGMYVAGSVILGITGFLVGVFLTRVTIT